MRVLPYSQGSVARRRTFAKGPPWWLTPLQARVSIGTA